MVYRSGHAANGQFAFVCAWEALVSSNEPRIESSRGRLWSASTDGVSPSHKREFWRGTALNRSVADFRPDDRCADFNARMWSFVGRKCEMRFGQSDPIIMRRTPTLLQRDGGDEILL